MPKRITRDEAAAALTAAAWTEEPGADAYGKTVDAVRAYCDANAGAMIDPAAVEHLITVNLGEPRTLIHCYLGFIGCDWDLAAAVKVAQRDDAACSWERGLAGHDLRIETGGKAYWFDARRPGDA